MFKVLIVEDERRTARSIAQLVDEHADFHVEGLAGNGAEALVYLGKSEFDLVLTDIRMPGIDGIQLLEILHKQYPACLSVVLSGYSEFDYARAAIQYGAFNYLLKPIDEEDLDQVLEEAARRLSSQKQIRLREQIQRALDGRKVAEDFSVQMVLLQGEAVNTWTQPEQLSSLQQYFGRDCLPFNRTHSQELLLILPDSAALSASVETFFPVFRHGTTAPSHLIFTEHPVPLQDLAAAVQHLHDVLEQHIRLFRSDFFSANLQTALMPDSAAALRLLHPDRAVETIIAQDTDSLAQCLRQTIRTCTRRADLQNYLFAIVRDPRLAYSLSAGKLEQIRARLTRTISLATEPDACIGQLVPQLLSLPQASSHKQGIDDLAEALVQYLDLNYPQQISIDALARQYGISTRYLNKIFKEQTGTRPSEYLLNLRMERAKQMLAANPDAMIKDIANSVGYTDPLYFSKVFQKSTGHWPTEYQQASHK